MVTQGDIIIVDFDPSLGSEQKGRRPGLVVSNETYHKNTNGFAIVVPITSDKSYHFPLHVQLDERTKTGERLCVSKLKRWISKREASTVLNLFQMKYWTMC